MKIHIFKENRCQLIKVEIGLNDRNGLFLRFVDKNADYSSFVKNEI